MPNVVDWFSWLSGCRRLLFRSGERTFSNSPVLPRLFIQLWARKKERLSTTQTHCEVIPQIILFFLQELDIFAATTGLHQRANYALSAVLLAIHESAAPESAVEISSALRKLIASFLLYFIILSTHTAITVYTHTQTNHVLYAPQPHLNYKNKLPDFILPFKSRTTTCFKHKQRSGLLHHYALCVEPRTLHIVSDKQRLRSKGSV